MTLFNLQNQAVVKVLALLTMIMMVASLVPVSVFAQAEGETPAEPAAEPQVVAPVDEDSEEGDEENNKEKEKETEQSTSSDSLPLLSEEDELQSARFVNIPDFKTWICHANESNENANNPFNYISVNPVPLLGHITQHDDDIIPSSLLYAGKNLTTVYPEFGGLTGQEILDLECEIPKPEKEELLITITGNTTETENTAGRWMFNRDTNTDTPIEFNTDESVIGDGALNVLPIGVTPADKFIGEYFYQGDIDNLESFSYDFKIGSGGDNADEEQFYMNVYANFAASPATKFYDCRYNVVPTIGSTGGFTTVTFDPTQAYPVTKSGSSPEPTCPAVPADMDNAGPGATIRMFALNLGDTSASDTGIDGYFDNVVLDEVDLTTTFDFEPARKKDEVTVVATKLVCEDESDLPNWGNGQYGPITADTAADWVENSEGACEFQEGWQFQYADQSGPDTAGDFVGESDDYTTFENATNENGVTTETILLGKNVSELHLREVLQDGYLPFSKDNEDDVSAEFYCADDVLNYDNWDFVRNPEAGETYHCVAWNVLEVTDDEPTVCSIAGEVVDMTENAVKFNGSPVDANRRTVGGLQTVASYSNFLGKDGNSWNPSDFLTLGVGGFVTYMFTDAVVIDKPGADIAIWEITGGATSEDSNAKANVSVSADGITFVSLGGIVGDAELDIAPAGLPFVKYVKVTDNSVSIGNDDGGDGYDVDAITIINKSCGEIPEQPVCEIGKNLLANGSFEVTPVVTDNGGQWQIFAAISDWIVGLSDGIEVWNTFNGVSDDVASDGLQNVELDGNNATRLTQSAATIPGATYELKFDFSPRATIGAADNVMAVLVDGATVDTVNGDGTGTTTNSWTPKSQTFVAASTSTEIGFEDIGTANDNGGYGPLLDNVALCLVREPEPLPTCSLTITSDATDYVVEKNAMAQVLSTPYHPSWVPAIGTSTAKWIWGDNPVADPVNASTQTFKKGFNWTGGAVTSATLKIASDNNNEITLGSFSGGNPTEFNYSSVATLDVSAGIVPGANMLSIEVDNFPMANGTVDTNPAGLIYELTITGTGESCGTIVPEVPKTTGTVTMCKVDAEDEPLSGWTMTLLGDTVDSVVVPAGNAAGVNTTASLDAGKSYVAVAQGTWNNNRGPLNIVDAEYSTEDNWVTQMDGFTGFPTDILELSINNVLDPQSQWGSYNGDHTYAQMFTQAATGTAKFHIADTFYGDNTGSLNVTVFEGYAGITGENGCVTFTNVPFGTYDADEVLQAGWEQLDGAGEVSVTYNNPTPKVTIMNEMEDDGDDDNDPETYILDGYKYACTEEYASRLNSYDYEEGYYNCEDAETVSGWTIFAQNGDNTPISTTTDENGYYYFEVEEGDWTVYEGEEGDDWEQVSVEQNWEDYENLECSFEIEDDTIWEYARSFFNDSEEDAYRCDFYNYFYEDYTPQTYTVTGVKWNDVDGDGVKDEDESNLSGWTITAVKGLTTISTTTDINGNYTLILPYEPGEWVISETQQGGWTQTGLYSNGSKVTLGGEVSNNCSFYLGALAQSATCDFGNKQNPVVDEEPEPTSNRGGGSSSGTRVTNRATPQGLVLGAATGTPACGMYLQDYMRMGNAASTTQVTKLQVFLNAVGITAPLTGIFDAATDAAVRTFQAQHKAEVLTPWYLAKIVPHENPTGWVYQLTRWKINNIVCPGSEAYPVLN